MSGNEDNKEEKGTEIAEKAAKTVPRKKLPALMRRTLTQRAFEKRILAKLYIEDDREFVRSLFTETVEKGKPGKGKRRTMVRIPLGAELAKADAKRLKELAKQIKRNRGRVKLVPLAACAALVAAGAAAVCAFKNVVAKKLLVSACESAFHARTDVRSVEVELLGISVNVKGLAVGNKDSVMKNLFEAEDITLSVNLTQALRGKFVAEEMSVTGMKFGTPRATSCELPEGERTAAESAAAAVADSAFAKSLKERSGRALEELKGQAEAMLGGSSPEEILGNLRSQLKTPGAAAAAKDGIQAIADKWREKPAEMKAQVEGFADEVRSLRDLDVNAIAKGSDIPTRVAALKDALERINSAVSTGNELKGTFERTVGEVKEDAGEAVRLSESVVEAAKSDAELAKGMVEGAVDTVRNARNIFTRALDTVGYSMLGKYYPYVRKGIDYGLQMKANAAAENDGKKKEEEPKGEGRMKGTTLWFGAEYPALLIKRVAASGTADNESGSGFAGSVEEITSNQDVRGKPTTARLTFDAGGVNHSGSLVLDARTRSSAPLISAEYTGRGFHADIAGADIASASGVPSIEGTAVVTAKGTAGADGFSASGLVSLDPVRLTTDGFANETVTKYYRQALDTVRELSVGFSAGYSSSSGVELSLDGNFADKFAEALRAVVESVFSDARAQAAAKLNDLINDESNEVAAKAKEFLGIEGDIDVQNGALDTLRTALENKRNEIQSQIENAAKAKLDEAKARAQEEIDAAKAKAQAEADAAKAKAQAEADAAKAKAQAEADAAKKRAEAEAEAAKKRAEEEAKNKAADALRGGAGGLFRRK